MKSRSREINPSGSASLCDERALTLLDGSRMAYDGIMGRTKYGRVASASPFFFFLFLNLDTSFSSKDRKNHSHDVKETWNYSVRMHDCRMIGGYYRLLACTDKSKGEEKETAYIYIY